MIPDEICRRADKVLTETLSIRAALESVVDDLTAAARAEGMEWAAGLQPPTAEDPNETAYQRGRFDGIIEFGTAIHTRAREIRSSLKPKATGEG